MLSISYHRNQQACVASFEALVRKFRLNDNPALREIAEIVHDIDLKDDKFHRLEAAGLITHRAPR